MPQAMSPGWRGRTEKPVARTDAGAIQSGQHQRDQGAMLVLHGSGKLPGCAGRILEDGEIISSCPDIEAVGKSAELFREGRIRDMDRDAIDPRRNLSLLGIGD